MSNHTSGRRHRSSERNSGENRRRSPSRIFETYIRPPTGPEKPLRMDDERPSPPLPPPLVYDYPETGEDSFRPRPPRMEYGYGEYQGRPPRMPRFEYSGREDEFVEGPDGSDDAMPEIQQTSLPQRRPEPDFDPASDSHIRINSRPTSKPPVTDEGKSKPCEDLRLSAVKKATEDWVTLNSIMICVYRSSRRRFDSRRVWLVRREYREQEGDLLDSYLRDDEAFFDEIIWKYKRELRGTLRRFISFKTVSTARLLEYGNGRFGTAGMNAKMFSPVFMAIYNDPEASLKKGYPKDWVKWFRRVRLKGVRRDKVDLAIELMEDYDPMRVMGSIAFALGTLLILTAVWLIRGGDPAYVSSVMSFVLGFIGSTVALTALWDFLDLGHMGGGKDYLVLDQKEFHRAIGFEEDWDRPGRQFYSRR